MITIFGIKNCDSVKKARKWLDTHGIEYTFVDFREGDISTKTIAEWINADTVIPLINKRSTTWKNLSANEQAQVTDWIASIGEGDNTTASTLASWLVENLTLIKRPVASHSDGLTIGFKADDYQALFT